MKSYTVVCLHTSPRSTPFEVHAGECNAWKRSGEVDYTRRYKAEDANGAIDKALDKRGLREAGYEPEDLYVHGCCKEA